jgi:O-antigen ligase
MGEKSREKKERKDGSQEILRERPADNGRPILWWVILIGTCLALFIPFVVSGKYFFPFVGPKSIYFMGLAEIIFVAWLILMISRPKYRPKINTISIALVLFLAIFIISSFLGVDFSRSFWSKYERMTGILMQLHLFAFFLVVSSTFRKKEDWLKIFGVSVFAAVLMSFVSFYPKILGSMADLARGGATLGNSSFLGTYLLFNLFFAIYLFFNSRKTIKILSAFPLIIIAVALFLSTARAAFISGVVGLILLFLLWLVFCNKGKLKLIGVLLIVVLFISAALGAYFFTQPNSSVYKATFDKVFGQTFGGRFIVWQAAWQGFLEKPFFGWGPENFELAFTRDYNPCLGGSECGGDIWYDRAHNIVFDTLSTTGAFGMISYLGIFVAVFYVLWKKFFQKELGFWAAGTFSVVLVSYFIQNLTVFDMINSYIMFFLVLGFVGAVQNQERESLAQKKVPVILLAAILILFIFSFSYFVIKPLKADNYIIRSLGLPLGSQERLDSYQKTLTISPVGKYQIRDFFAQSTLESIQGTTDFSKISFSGLKNEMDFIIQELEKSTKESPLDFRAYLKLGQAYDAYTVVTKISKLQEAEQTLQMAIKLSPKNQQGYWALAQTKIYQGKINEALSLAQEALALELKSESSNLIVIQIAQMTGDQNLVEEQIKKALEINPAWEADIQNVLKKQGG